MSNKSDNNNTSDTDPTYPVTDDNDYESHPAFGVVEISHTSGSGRALFQSDLLHNNTVSLKVLSAERQRSLGGDHVFSRQSVVEIEMSLNQWAQLVASHSGRGVPVTIRRRPADDANITTPAIAHQPRIAENLTEVNEATARTIATISEKFTELATAVEERKGIKVLRPLMSSLKAAIDNAPSNATFAVTQMNRAAEKLFTTAVSDIEYKAGELSNDLDARARALGLDPGETGVSALTGSPVDTDHLTEITGTVTSNPDNTEE